MERIVSLLLFALLITTEPILTMRSPRYFSLTYVATSCWLATVLYTEWIDDFTGQYLMMIPTYAQEITSLINVLPSAVSARTNRLSLISNHRITAPRVPSLRVV
jgi:hypothetical protein